MPRIAGADKSGLPIGSILPLGKTSMPTGVLACDGSAVSRSTYALLFTAIGTTYGVGDGSTTFNVPNGQGVFLRGHGSQTIGGVSYTGTQGSSQNDSMQGHRHNYSDPTHVHGPGGGGTNFLEGGSAGGSVVPGSAGSLGTTTAGAVTGLTITDPNNDGTNGSPRTGGETRPASVGVRYGIAYL